MGETRQRPAYINQYLFCIQSHVLPLHWNKPMILYTGDPTLLETMQLLYGSTSTELLYGSSSTAAPLQQLLYGSFSAATTGFRPLTLSRSFCDVVTATPSAGPCISWGAALPYGPSPPSSGASATLSLAVRWLHTSSLQPLAAVQRSFCDVISGSPLASGFVPLPCSPCRRPA